MGGITFRISSPAYHAILDDEAVLPPGAQEALERAVLVAGIWWVVDTTDEATAPGQWESNLKGPSVMSSRAYSGAASRSS